jgi:hypothetical protein
MAKNKTTFTEQSVQDYLNTSLNDEKKKADSFTLIELMKQVSGHEPKMWGPTIIGFGLYAYTYPSGHSGEAPLIGFSPRKAAISLYVFTGLDEHAHLLDGLGKFTMGKACIYVKRLADIDLKVLSTLMNHTISYLQNKYG